MPSGKLYGENPSYYPTQVEVSLRSWLQSTLDVQSRRRSAKVVTNWQMNTERYWVYIAQWI